MSLVEIKKVLVKFIEFLEETNKLDLVGIDLVEDMFYFVEDWFVFPNFFLDSFMNKDSNEKKIEENHKERRIGKEIDHFLEIVMP
jgi:hypothetical protein